MLRLALLFPVLVLLACSSQLAAVDKSPSFAFTDTRDTRLGKAFSETVASHPGQSGFHLLVSGLDAYAARVRLMTMAERSIDAQYYLLHDDLTGKLFLHQLLQAADRGVRVRLLLDDMGVTSRVIGVLNSHPNIEVRIFNPFDRAYSRLLQYFTRFGSVTRRMHNKSLTADNQVTLIGGRNIGDEYFEADPELAFTDLDIIGVGPVAQAVSQSFDNYWNHALSHPVEALQKAAPAPGTLEQERASLARVYQGQLDSHYARALRGSTLAQKISQQQVDFAWGQARVVADHPEKIATDRARQQEYSLSADLVQYFSKTTRELLIFSPYFVPGDEGVAFLTDLARRGITIRILTNSLASTDVAVVHAGYKQYRKPLLRAGIILYEMNRVATNGRNERSFSLTGSSKASLHAKSFVLDDRYLFVGSLNLDPRSLVENTEIGVMIDSPALAGSMTAWFDANIEQLAYRVELVKDAEGAQILRWVGRNGGEPVLYSVEPNSSFWDRLRVNLMRLLPLESQL